MLGLDAGVVGGGDDSLRAAMVKSKTKRQNEFESMAAMIEAKCVAARPSVRGRRSLLIVRRAAAGAV